MKDVDIQAALKKFPEGLASGVDERLKPNMQVQTFCWAAFVGQLWLGNPYKNSRTAHLMTP